MDVVVPGPRDVRATLDRPTGARAGSDPGSEADALVVACPPHPQMGGRRTDGRLRAVSEALTGRGVACLRFDYGDWDEGYGERADAERAVAWGRERYDRVGLFGYSFGGCVAVLAAAALADGGTDAAPAGTGDGGEPVTALSTLAAASRLGEDRARDGVAALERVDCPTQVVYGERDTTADWAPLVERARELAAGDARVELVALSADHHFVGQQGKVGRRVAGFLRDAVGAPPF